MTETPIHYLTPGDIYAIAEQVLGRRPDVRDRHLLRKAAGRPMLVLFGEEMFPSLLDKAAALLHTLAAHHLFYDGNKRTATAAATRFLQMNGVTPTWDSETIAAFVLDVAQNKYDVAAIADWLVAHTERAGEPMATRYLTVDELVYMNEQIPTIGTIHKILKGKQQVRDMSLLEAAAGRPMLSAFGQDAYRTLEEKAAALLHSIARNHPFADGNKRTATVAAVFMLAVNGRRVTWNPGEALRRITAVAEGELDVADLAGWLTTAPGEPLSVPDAAHDEALIERILGEHGWLLDQLAGR